MRTYATGESLGFESFSPYTLPNVIEISEGIPFIDITGWDHNKLYELKGQLVSDGIKSVTGFTIPIFPKRRFQHGAVSAKAFIRHFPEKETAYRKEFLSSYE
jgi:asparagine synthase (glutamine-hydrolysing)